MFDIEWEGGLIIMHSKAAVVHVKTKIKKSHRVLVRYVIDRVSLRYVVDRVSLRYAVDRVSLRYVVGSVGT